MDKHIFQFESVPAGQSEHPNLVTRIRDSYPTITQLRADYNDTVADYFAQTEPNLKFPPFGDICITNIAIEDFDGENMIYLVTFYFFT